VFARLRHRLLNIREVRIRSWAVIFGNVILRAIVGRHLTDDSVDTLRGFASQLVREIDRLIRLVCPFCGLLIMNVL
jgi:hypothetical protein